MLIDDTSNYIIGWLYHIIIRLEAMVKSCIIMDDIHLYYTYYIGGWSYHHRFMGN